MPNLDHDPQNPTDLLDRPIAVGDIVAWGTTLGRSAALTVCLIEKIRFIKHVNGKNKEVPQAVADDYQLILKPIKGTGNVSNDEYVPNGFYSPEQDRTVYFRQLPWGEWKSKTVLLVKNIVKLDLTLDEALALAGIDNDG